MPVVNKDRMQTFESAAEFRHWLQENHKSQTELWLKIYKKGSGVKSINWEEAVLECLCWGWIDGVKKSLDDSAYIQRVTPRRAKSNWSKRNCEHVEKLIAGHKMQASGLIHVKTAQADGRWEAAYAPPSEMTVPAYFVLELNKYPKAQQFFLSLNKTKLYTIAYQLQAAKKPETRQRRMENIIRLLEKGETL